MVTPREEDPQIVVPMADVLILMPGASAREVENLVTVNLERKFWEIDRVEHVYSISPPGMALVTVRFCVGEDRNANLVKIYNKLESNRDAVPPGVTGWLVKPLEINDVLIVTLTLYGRGQDEARLRRVADEIVTRLKSVPDTGRTSVVGGRPRQIRVELDPQRMAARGVSPLDVEGALRGADARLRADSCARDNREYLVDSGPFLRSAGEVASTVLAAPGGKPVYLRDLAAIMDGPAEPSNRTMVGFGPARKLIEIERGQLRPRWMGARGRVYPAVTIAIAKRRGTNAVSVADGVLEKFASSKAP